MVWGSITGKRLGDLVKIDGIMDKVYHNILVRHAIPYEHKLITRGKARVINSVQCFFFRVRISLPRGHFRF